MIELKERAKNISFALAGAGVLLACVGFLGKAPLAHYIAIGGLLLLVLVMATLLTTYVSALAEKAREREGSAQKARSELMSTLQQKKEISERFDKNKFLADLLKTISESNDLGSVLDRTLDQTMGFFVAKSGFVMLIDEISRELYVERAAAKDGQPVHAGRLPIGEGVVGSVAATGTARLMAGTKKLPGRHQTTSGTSQQSSSASSQSALMCAPLRIERKIIGVLTIEERDSDDNFSEGDLEFLSLIAAETGIAIEKARLYERMEQMSVTDGLTGVANRRHFDARLHDEILKARRYNLPLAVTLMDIDNFKSFNDTYGHAVGDEILKSLAKTIRANVRDTDLVARYGGEEFVIVSPDCKVDQAAVTAERLRGVVEELEVRGSDEYPALRVAISLGVAVFPEDGPQDESLLKAADDALYHSKESGRNQVTLSHDIRG